MKTVSKSKLKAHMLEIFREIEESGEELIVTHRDKPVLRIVPFEEKVEVSEAFAGLQGQVVYHADPDEPMTDEWEDA